MFGIPLSWIAAGILALSVGGYIWHSEATKTNFAQYKARIEALAQAREAENAREVLRQAKNKERTDAEHDRRLRDMRAANKRLRDELSASFVPAASPSSTNPDRACFDRGELDRALRDFAQGVQGLVEEGGEAVIGLDAARDWVRSR